MNAPTFEAENANLGMEPELKLLPVAVEASVVVVTGATVGAGVVEVALVVVAEREVEDALPDL